MNEKKIEKIAKAFEDVSNRSVNAMENLESKLNDLDTNTKKNKSSKNYHPIKRRKPSHYINI